MPEKPFPADDIERNFVPQFRIEPLPGIVGCFRVLFNGVEVRGVDGVELRFKYGCDGRESPDFKQTVLTLTLSNTVEVGEFDYLAASAAERAEAEAKREEVRAALKAAEPRWNR